MKRLYVLLLVMTLVAVSCTNRDDVDREPPVPVESGQVTFPAPPSTTQSPERVPIDLGDVDSGILVVGMLAPEAESDLVVPEYVETQRGTLAMTTITVTAPFPERLPIRFELASLRNFEERPVVLRLRAYRDDDTVMTGENAFVLGREAMLPRVDQAMQFRNIVVDALEGLDSIPETMLLHARAEAFLMETGTAEDLLDPRVATSPDRVTLVSNPVRINFVQPESAQ